MSRVMNYIVVALVCFIILILITIFGTDKRFDVLEARLDWISKDLSDAHATNAALTKAVNATDVELNVTKSFVEQFKQGYLTDRYTDTIIDKKVKELNNEQLTLLTRTRRYDEALVELKRRQKAAADATGKTDK